MRSNKNSDAFNKLLNNLQELQKNYFLLNHKKKKLEKENEKLKKENNILKIKIKSINSNQ